jgi:hypothetical protein
MQNGATNFIIISSCLGAEIDGSPHAEVFVRERPGGFAYRLGLRRFIAKCSYSSTALKSVWLDQRDSANRPA